MDREERVAKIVVSRLETMHNLNHSKNSQVASRYPPANVRGKNSKLVISLISNSMKTMKTLRAK